MLIIGYQGIGKSTTVKTTPGKYIDLESTCFYAENGTRPDDWYVYYCNTALDLSKQGYDVFVSSHNCVQEYLSKHIKNDYLIAIVPSIDLKEQWIERLYNRYLFNSSDKNYRAWKNAEDCYIKNITSIYNNKFLFNDIITLDSLEYNLDGIIFSWKYHNFIK